MLIRGYSQHSFNENLTPLKRGLIRAYPCHSSVISPWLSLTGTLRPVSTGTSVGSVHIYWPGAVPEHGTRWELMSPHFFTCPRQSLVTMPVINYKVEIPEGGGVLRILSGGNDRMGAKIENPRASNKTPKIPGPNINPQKTHAVFPSLKNFQKSLNDNTLNFLWSYYIRRFTRLRYAGTTTNLQIVLNTQKIPT